jgi:Rod binding domain-containing protein
MIASSGSLHELRALATADDPGAARRVAQEFEALVVGEMLRLSSKPIAGEHPLDGGSAGRMAREQLHAELARIVSHGRGLGLAAQLEGQMRAAEGDSESEQESRS